MKGQWIQILLSCVKRTGIYYTSIPQVSCSIPEARNNHEMMATRKTKSNTFIYIYTHTRAQDSLRDLEVARNRCGEEPR